MMPPRKNKQKSRTKPSDDAKGLNPNDTAFFEALMSDPEKKKLVLELLSQEKETIAEYKRNAETNKQFGATTPLKRVKQKYVCESPTALMRRRALQKQQNERRNSPLETQSASSCSVSRESVSSSPSPVSFDNLLKDVIAYVEIRSKDTDRSAGAKALMISMGATIRNTFTADVTHVVFKDGSFTTYQKAKLMKVYMVSVLWLEAVRRSQTRVPEKNYPALGTEMFDNNISSICSQLQKEYEEVVREDVRRSLAMGTPLPSTKSLLSSNRRQTMMTPFTSSQYFSERFRLSQELPSTQDREVDGILSDKQRLLRTIFENPTTPSHDSSILASPSPEITSDDESNCGVVDGDFGAPNRHSDTIIFETPEYLEDPNIMKSVENFPQTKLSETRLSLTDMMVTPIRRENDNSTSSNNSKSLIGGLRKSTNMDLTENISTYSKAGTFSTNKENRISSDKSTNISDNSLFQKSSNSKQTSIDASKNSSTNMSRLHISSESSSKKADATGTSEYISTKSNNTNMSVLQVSSSVQKDSDESARRGVDSHDSGTNMSKLRISSESSGKKVNACRTSGSLSTRSSNTNMSALQVSSGLQKDFDGLARQEVTTHDSGTNMSRLRISAESSGKKANATGTSGCISMRSSNTNMSVLQVSSVLQKDFDGSVRQEVASHNSGTNMSNLQYSSSNDRPTRKRTCSKDNSTDVSKATTDTNMSSLRVSSDLFNNRQHKHSNKRSSDTSMSNLQISNDGQEKNHSDTHVIDDSTKSPLKNSTGKDGISTKVFKKKPVVLVQPYDHNQSQNINTISNPSKDHTARTNNQPNLDSLCGVQSHDENNFDRNVTKRTRRRLFPRQDPNSKSSDKATEYNVSNKDSSMEKNANITEGVTNNNDNSSETSGSDSAQSNRKRLRKLYNPDGSIVLDDEQCDEEERNLKRRHVKKQLPCDFLDPNMIKLVPIVLTARNKTRTNRKTTSVNISSSSEDISPPKNIKKKTKIKKSNKKSIRYSSADEQKALASEFVTKKITRGTQHKVDASSDVKRKEKQSNNFKTPSIKKRAKKTQPSRTDSQKSGRISQQYSCTPLPIVPVQNRRSTLEFQPLTPMTSTKKKKLNAKLPSIVCTKFHKDDCVVFAQIVRKLGGFVVEDEVSERTTHLVAGEAKRTINMLRAIAQGCWILKQEWLLGSLEHGKWLPEEDYEVVEFSPAVQQCRLERQAFGPSYSMDIFEGCDPIHIARSSIPRCSDLQELVILCKGTVTTILRNAKIIVGEYVASSDVTCVTESWILDSITFNKKKPLKKYLLKN